MCIQYKRATLSLKTSSTCDVITMSHYADYEARKIQSKFRKFWISREPNYKKLKINPNSSLTYMYYNLPSGRLSKYYFLGNRNYDFFVNFNEISRGGSWAYFEEWTLYTKHLLSSYRHSYLRCIIKKCPILDMPNAGS